MSTFREWDRRLVVALGGRPDAGNLAFLDAWQRAEGGTASFNPLNTTLVLHGSTDYNHAGVQNYADELQGLCGTILTLRLPYYRRVVAALRRGGLDGSAILRASITDVRTWGTSPELIGKVLGQRK